MVETKQEEYKEEEREQIVDYLIALKKPLIAVFLEQHELLKSGTKANLRARIEDALEEGELMHSDIVNYLDLVAPWGKQHVFLYDGPTSPINQWRDRNWLRVRLNQVGADHYLNESIPLILPINLSVSSIQHFDERLRIIAVRRREHLERKHDQDRETISPDGKELILRAYERQVTRGLVIFEWNFVANIAMMQITQLPSGIRYQEVARAFSELVQDWIDLEKFQLVDVSAAIARLHALEENNNPETRTHSIDYMTPGGRRLEGRSASRLDPLLGEQVIDSALRNVRVGKGTGRIGNFYWLPKSEAPDFGNPLEKEVHVFIVGKSKRVRFTTPNTEEVVLYVLSRIREHCK